MYTHGNELCKILCCFYTVIVSVFKSLGGVWKLWVKGNLVEWQIDLDFEVGQGIKIKPSGVFLPYKWRYVLRGKKTTTLAWAELRKHLCVSFLKTNKPSSNHCIFLFCFVAHPNTVKKHTEATQGSLSNKAGKVKQRLALRSLPSNKLPVFTALKDCSHCSWWQGSLPSLGKEDQRTSALWEKGSAKWVQNLCPESPEKLAGSTGIGKIAPSDKKAMSKSDWSERRERSSLFALPKCKTQLCKWIRDSLWKHFSTCSSQLLSETLEGKAVQVPTCQSCWLPLGLSSMRWHPINSHLQGCCIAGCISAEVPRLLTLTST